MQQNDQQSAEKLHEHIQYLENILKQSSISFESYSQKQEKLLESSQCQSKPKPFQTNLNEQILNKQQIERYSRQMLLEEVGYEGQKKISSSKVLVVGAGGIGAPALLYLAGMGVGEIGIIDDDRVEESNLHRQVIHNQERVGVNKAESAKRTLQQFNKRVNITTYEYRLNNQNANSIFKNYDIILDASDNPKTRYLVNDAAITNKKILVSGSAIGWEGQLTVYGYNNGPCYRCLFPVSPKGSGVKSCGEAGVIGMIPGIIGQLEALEALKIMLQEGNVLSQQFLLFDGKQGSFKRVKLRPRQKQCQVCGENPTITNVEQFNYDEFVEDTCGVNKALPSNTGNFKQMSWSEFVPLYQEKKNQEQMQLIDIRFASQRNIVHLKDFQSVPFDAIKEMSEDEIAKTFNKDNGTIFISCRRGINSITISNLLCEKGYTNVVNIKGGLEAYAKEYDETIPFF